MTPQQIAAVYDSMTPEEQNMPREQFIKKVSGLMDPGRMVRTINAMVQKKHWGMRNKRQIDLAIKGGPK